MLSESAADLNSVAEANGEQPAAFEILGKYPKLGTDGTTITSWFSSKCGGSVGTTASPSLP